MRGNTSQWMSWAATCHGGSDEGKAHCLALFTALQKLKNVPDSWIKLTLTEGRNRQVRRMTAAVGHPTLRLIRYRIGAWTIDGIDNGQWIETSA